MNSHSLGAPDMERLKKYITHGTATKPSPLQPTLKRYAAFGFAVNPQLKTG